MENKPIFKFALREDLKDNKEFLPKKAEPNATGWDVKAAPENHEKITILPFERILIPLGLRAFCPEGWWFELKPRSSTFSKKGLHCLYGTIDSDYEGFLYLACQYIPNRGKLKQSQFIYNLHEEMNDLIINFGDALGQIIPVRKKEMLVEEVSNEEYDELCKQRNSVRGSGGFGSTGV